MGTQQILQMIENKEADISDLIGHLYQGVPWEEMKSQIQVSFMDHGPSNNRIVFSDGSSIYSPDGEHW